MTVASDRRTKTFSSWRLRRRPQHVAKRVLIVVPTRSEGPNIVGLLAGIRNAIPNATVLVVDEDGSDRTASRAERLAVHLGNITVIRLGVVSGPGAAYRAGYDHGLTHGYDIVLGLNTDSALQMGALPA